jgi:putative transcriptional regulator
MALVYKIDVLQALKDKGYNTNKLRQEKILAESTIQKLRESKPISWANISQICGLLNCQPNHFLEYVKDE